jgi:hypothetical protein
MIESSDPSRLVLDMIQNPIMEPGHFVRSGCRIYFSSSINREIVGCFREFIAEREIHRLKQKYICTLTHKKQHKDTLLNTGHKFSIDI